MEEDFRVDNDTLVAYFGNEKHIVLISGIKQIGEFAFKHCIMESIEIPNSVERIADNAFYQCSSLTTLKIPHSVKDIGRNFYSNCDSLKIIEAPIHLKGKFNFDCYVKYTMTEEERMENQRRDFEINDGVLLRYKGGETTVEIPKGVVSIGRGAFDNCDFVQKITLPSSLKDIARCELRIKSLITIDVNLGNPYFKSIDGVLYSKDGKTMYRLGIGRALKQFSVPNGVEKLSCAFEGCKELETVKLPDSLKIIDRAFCDSGLNEVRIPQGVTEIGEYAFASTKLQEAIIPDSVTVLNNDAFSHCKSLRRMDIPKNIKKIGNYAFYNCESLYHISFPAGLQEIGKWAFDTTALQAVNFPYGLTSIGEYAFSGTKRLTFVELPASITSIGEGAFCTSSISNVIVHNKAFKKAKEYFPYGCKIKYKK